MKKIKILLSYLFFFFNAFFSYSQSELKCRKCKTEIQEKHLNKFADTENKLTIIKTNWNETFFKKLWETDLSFKYKNTLSLRFDGLGCIYPDLTIKADLEQQYKNIFKKGNNNFIDGNSFYRISENANENTMKNFWIKYLNIDKTRIINNIDNLAKNFKPQMDFYKQWNEYFLKNKVNEINQLIKIQNIKKMVFIIHGYNVPYSLALIQHENIIEKYSQIADTNNVLFIPVYWPSTDRKKWTNHDEKFFFKNKISFRSINEYDKIMYRPLIIGATLRQIINSVEKVDEIQFIGHSLAAGVITSALIPPLKYLQPEASERYNLLTTIPTKPNAIKVRVFLNAPAIGKKIFEDIASIDTNTIDQINWFVGVNPTDRVLARPKVIRKLFPKDNDNTRLGANLYRETEYAQDLFNKLNKGKNFQFGTSGKQRDLFGHDFFCYLIQSDFQKQLENFILNKN